MSIRKGLPEPMLQERVPWENGIDGFRVRPEPRVAGLRWFPGYRAVWILGRG